jgi:hypothetical protein
MTKMSTNNLSSSCLNIFASVGFLTLLCVLCNCASTKPTVTAAQYRFTLNDEVYRIRSITSSDNSLSYNELLGDKFLAIDFDQDRIIDRITIGNIELADAQKIYDYGLLMLSQENKLQERSPENHKYVYDDPNFYIEIKTFRPAGANPFNEFKITNKQLVTEPKIIVALDGDADGTLDKILKGTEPLEKLQAKYIEAIENGLRINGLIKVDSMILVKEK